MASQGDGFSSTVTSVVTVTVPPSGPTAGFSNNDSTNSNNDQGSDQNQNQHQTDDQSSISSGGLSGRDEKIVIATTVIGGTLILALLIYIILRRRRGATYTDIVRFRPQSSVVTLSQHPDKDHLTALPIYQQTRLSIRSSRHPSLANLRQAKRAAAIPSPLRTMTEAESRVPAWNSSEVPRTPSMNGRWQTFLQDASPSTTVREPETAHMGSLNKVPTLNLPSVQRSSAAYGPLSGKGDEDHASLTPMAATPSTLQDLGDRWSWTNSQAPSTPRIAAPNTRLSLTSTSSRMRNVAAWVRKGGEQPSKGKSRPLLKNQATQPVLAPLSNRRASKGGRHRRVGSLSSIFKSTPTLNPPLPLSPRLQEEQQQLPVMSANIEMTQKS